jgi:septal ring factor EnvC (AmiA/AmiB activator)
MSFSTLFSIAKHLWPSVWFAAVFKEAEHVPAVVAGLFFTSGAVLLLSVLAILQYSHDAEANEKRLSSLQQTIAKNTTELTCAKQDRSIAYLERQLSRLMQLAETVEDPQSLNTEITELKRNLRNAQTTYERECL